MGEKEAAQNSKFPPKSPFIVILGVLGTPTFPQMIATGQNPIRPKVHIFSCRILPTREKKFHFFSFFLFNFIFQPPQPP